MAKRRPQQASHAAVHVPPPIGGINATSLMSGMPESDCLYAYNFFPSRYGMRSRPGYTKWCNAITAGAGGIRTIIPFVSEGGGRKLFAATADGIFDITSGTGAPPKVYDFSNKSTDAGWVSWTHFTNLAGTQFILAADQANGYIVYDGGANTWAVGALTGVSPSAIVHVTSWKNRVWLTVRNSTLSYYVDAVGTIGGDVTPFDFGSKFKYGGHLVGIWNWTTDGGSGIDDYLVAISSQGDVAVYAGWDPTTATGEGAFQLRGVWYLGEMPTGRRGVLEEGGDILILTVAGAASLSAMVSGSSRGDAERTYYLTRKINTLIRASWADRIGLYGWELTSLPSYDAIMLVQPTLTGARPVQWMYSTETKGWFFTRDLPIQTIDTWGTRVFFGDAAGQAWELTGLLDAVDPALPDSGLQVEYSLLSSYQGFGEAARIKRAHMLRPYFIGGAAPQYAIAARYDFQLAEYGIVQPAPPAGSNAWDASTWDSGIWSGGVSSTMRPYGAAGIGRYVAVALRGIHTGDSAYMGCDMLLDGGGYL